MSKNNAKAYLTPNEVAEMLMLSVAAVRQWAEKGDLKALTTPGGHRRFLPQDVADFAQARHIILKKQTGKKTKVLIIDDDRALSRYLVALLSAKDSLFITEQAYDGFEAGQKVQSFQPDVVLLDLMMPGITGVQVCQNLKLNEQTKNIRVIAMTGYASPDNISAILSMGAEICLAKPIDQGKLLEALNKSN